MSEQALVFTANGAGMRIWSRMLAHNTAALIQVLPDPVIKQVLGEHVEVDAELARTAALLADLQFGELLQRYQMPLDTAESLLGVSVRATVGDTFEEEEVAEPVPLPSWRCARCEASFFTPATYAVHMTRYHADVKNASARVPDAALEDLLAGIDPNTVWVPEVESWSDAQCAEAWEWAVAVVRIKRQNMDPATEAKQVWPEAPEHVAAVLGV